MKMALVRSRIGGHLRRAGMTAARGVERGIAAVRPMYEAAKPMLKHYIDTGAIDKSLTSYDAIRKSLR